MSKTLVAVLLVLLMATAAMAQCKPPPPAGTEVQIAPRIVVTAVECPAYMAEGRTMLEHKSVQYYANNRSATMWVQPYPPMESSELAFMLQHGYGNFDGNASLDVKVSSKDGSSSVKLTRMGVGRYCGTAKFMPGWNRVTAWITTRVTTYLKVYNVWGGPLRDKPRMVNWMCPHCHVQTVSTSCPICAP